MDLKLRWKEFCKRAGMAEAGAVFDTHIAAAYSEPHRKYHTLAHIEECLKLLDGPAKHVLEDEPSWRILEDSDKDFYLNALELALWFHDIVYKPTESNNEEESERVMEELCESFAVDRELIDEAADLIFLTKDHKLPPLERTMQSKLMLDIDLAILGADPESFWAYERGIRFEYNFVPEDTYRRERTKVMQRFVDQEREGRLYNTALFRGVFNNQARQNLRHLVAYLSV